MSAPERTEIASLLSAHTNCTLTDVELERLRSYAADDPELAREVDEIEQLHRAFADERELMDRAAAPVDPAEEIADEFQRLQQAAARASDALRSKLEHGEPRVRAFAVGRSRRASWWLVVAAAMLIAGIWFAFRGDGRPVLDPQTPNDRTLGGAPAAIVLTAELHANQRSFAWLADPRARTYDVVLEAKTGEILLARSDEFATETSWELSPDEFARVSAHGGQIILRIEGKDGGGHTVASSGDRPVTIR
ncbi:MAG: hypothetical protein KDB80_03000 [Planctomycetes bacterium]|nr:hypothetical protein [Planctomycetota bacterium]